MIPWREIQRENIRDIKALIELLELTPAQSEELLSLPHFPLNIPRRLANKMTKGSLTDPLFLQFSPLKKELLDAPGYSSDPVGDLSAKTSSKLLHKYNGRALLVTTSACAMNCRYCFRQNFSHEPGAGFEAELNLIRNDPTLHEIILSGGDPLSLGDTALDSLMAALEKIPHLRILRFHTRFPVGIPERITPRLVERLSNSRLQTIFVIHINHPRELDADLIGALKLLQKQGIPILTQTVLLKGVNDSVEVLSTLFLSLIEQGIIPYYLHQLDRVAGSAHFEVTVDKGRELIEKLRAHLPGYAIPRYVQEIAGESSKTPL